MFHYTPPDGNAPADLHHRCRECRHPLTARASVAAGLGPVCRRRLAKMTKAAA